MRALLCLLSLTLCLPAAAEPQSLGGKGPPVLLVIGPEADEGLYTWDDDPRGGLAPHLLRSGFAVWTAGSGALADDVAAVQVASGGQAVALVGHGLGGTACHRYLVETGGQAPLAAVVTLGAPGRLGEPSPLKQAALEALAAAPAKRWSRLVFLPSPNPAAGPDLFTAACTNLPPERHDDALARAREAGATVPDPAMGDLPGWIAGAEPLPAVSFPVLAACGDKDRIAPCEEVLAASERLGETATFLKFGYMNLDRLAFGHLDLALADEARHRVFPVVTRFLKTGEPR